MATWNGLVCTTGGALGATASATVKVDPAVPNKFFKNGFLALHAVTGVSVGFYCNVYGYVGGASFLIAGRTAITAVGTYIMGTTGIATGGGVGPNPFPRPGIVEVGPTNGINGYTFSLYLAGEY